MPNHVKNIVAFVGDKAKIKSLLEAVQNNKYGFGTIDFNKIIPMPESLRIEAGSHTNTGLQAYREFVSDYLFEKRDANADVLNIPVEIEQDFLRQKTDVSAEDWALGKAAFQNMHQYGAPTWYEWSINSWGTKWNAYGYYEGNDYSTEDTLYFQTAWSAPHPILQRLSELFPDVEIIHEWADEDLGTNCGRYAYQSCVRMEETFPESDREAMEFALRLWEYTPEDLDLCLNSTETKYIPIEDEAFDLVEILDQPALFIDRRLRAEEFPKRLHCYALRQSDDGEHFVTLEPQVRVNHGGSIVMAEPIDFGEKGYISLTEDTELNFMGKALTYGQYMRSEFEQEQTQDEGMKKE